MRGAITVGIVLIVKPTIRRGLNYGRLVLGQGGSNVPRIADYGERDCQYPHQRGKNGMRVKTDVGK